MVSLEKKSPPGLLSLAKKAQVVLEKKGMGAHTASVGLCMDISGSMSPLFQNGTVQAVIERTLGLGLNFDDNGAIDLFAFGVQAHDLGELHPEQFKQASSDLLQRVSLEPGTMYAPPIQQIIKHYGFQPQAGFFKSLFGGKAKEAPRANPVYMLFVTDGENSDPGPAQQALIEASKFPIFFQFVGIGGGSFSFLRKLDDMPGRVLDNANFFEVANPSAINEEKLYEMMMVEYPGWVKQAKAKGFLA
jgi:hypothetical protein